MYRKRLRPAFTAEEFAFFYGAPFDVSGHTGHELRHRITADLCRLAMRVTATDVKGDTGRIMDLACGRAELVGLTPVMWNWTLGDVVKGHDFHGRIEETIHYVNDTHVLVMGELIEHLDDPEFVLAEARKRARSLVLSTPIAEGSDDRPVNEQHYWGWDQGAVEAMLHATGWTNTLAQVDLNIRDERIAPTQLWAVR